MAIRLGTVVEGSPYTITFEADKDNDGVSFVLIGWVPARPGVEPKAFALRVEPGQPGVHKENALPVANYFFIEIEVDLPKPKGAGTLKVDGLLDGPKVLSVTADQTYRIQIVAK